MRDKKKYGPGSQAWDGVIRMPVTGRSVKPRTTGLTMVIDKGVGLHQVADLMETAANAIDVIKLTFGTSAFYEQNLLKKKNAIIREGKIEVMPGGTFLEVAI